MSNLEGVVSGDENKGGPAVLPFYVVCDESSSMAGDSIDAVNDTVKDTMDLRNSLDNAKDKIEQFNEREQTFAQAPSEWPALDTLEKDFKPFYDLLDVGFNVGSMI